MSVGPDLVALSFNFQLTCSNVIAWLFRSTSILPSFCGNYSTLTKFFRLFLIECTASLICTQGNTLFAESDNAVSIVWFKVPLNIGRRWIIRTFCPSSASHLTTSYSNLNESLQIDRIQKHMAWSDKNWLQHFASEQHWILIGRLVFDRFSDWFSLPGPASQARRIKDYRPEFLSFWQNEPSLTHLKFKKAKIVGYCAPTKEASNGWTWSRTMHYNRTLYGLYLRKKF